MYSSSSCSNCVLLVYFFLTNQLGYRNILENTNLQLLYYTFSLVLNTSLLQRNRHSESIAKILFRAVFAKSESGKKKKKSFQRNFASFIFLLHLHQQSTRVTLRNWAFHLTSRKKQQQDNNNSKALLLEKRRFRSKQVELSCSNLFHIRNSSKDFFKFFLQTNYRSVCFSVKLSP